MMPISTSLMMRISAGLLWRSASWPAVADSTKYGRMNTPEQTETITSGDRPNSCAWVATIHITTAFLSRLSLNADSSCVTNSAKKTFAEEQFGLRRRAHGAADASLLRFCHLREI